MRIGMDLRWLHEATTHPNTTAQILGGVGRYSLELTQKLLNLDSQNGHFLPESTDPSENSRGALCANMSETTLLRRLVWK